MRNKIFLVLLWFTGSGVFCQETDIFNYNNSLKYANYLYNNKEFALALNEFKRILFIDSLNIQANIKIHDSYIRLGKYSEGIHYSNQVHAALVKNDTLAILRGKLLLLNGNFPQFNSEIAHDSFLSPGELVFLKMSEDVFQKNWKSAEKSLADAEKYPYLSPYIPIVKKAASIKYKKPAVSLMMSAIVPGSGKVYSGYWKDGLVSFLFVGISAWQSYRGFSQKGVNSVYSWIMGGISLSFYSGNIYGSVKAANKKNYELNHAILDDYKEAFISTYSSY